MINLPGNIQSILMQNKIKIKELDTIIIPKISLESVSSFIGLIYSLSKMGKESLTIVSHPTTLQFISLQLSALCLLVCFS